MADVILTDQNFEEEVMKSTTPVVVDFWAPWCTPCRIVTPIIHELAHEYTGKVKVLKMNVDENPKTAEKFNVLSIPTILMFKNGQPMKSLIGAQGKDTYRRAIDEALAN